MLDVNIYGKATITTTTRINDFLLTKKKIGNMRVFKDKSKKIISILEDEEDVVQKIAERYKAEAIIACSHQFFKYVVNSTNGYEIDIELFVSKKRKIVHYTAIGFEPTVLLIALDE